MGSPPRRNSRPEKTFGYARVSTLDQSPDLQVDALRAAHVPLANITTEYASGARERPLLVELVNGLQEGQTLVVWRLDRLARSVRELTELAGTLASRGVSLVSTQDAIDTRHAAGRLVFHVLASVAEFERDILVERCRAGMQAARARGAHIGRKHALGPIEVRTASVMLSEGERVAEVARKFGVSRQTLYASLRREGLHGTQSEKEA